MLQQWVARLPQRERKKRLKRSERGVQAAVTALRAAGPTEEYVDEYLSLLQGLSRFLIDMQIYRRNIGDISDVEMRAAIMRVRGGMQVADVGAPVVQLEGVLV